MAAAPGALAIALFASLGLGAGPSSAAPPISDVSPGRAAQLVARLMRADDAIVHARLTLPGAQKAVNLTSAAAALAHAEQQRVQVAGPPAPGVGPGDVVANATDAILDELAPEDAVAAVAEADQAVLATVQRRNLIQASLYSATRDRAAAVVSLRQSGARRTWWCVALLDRLGAPVTSENLRGLFAWIGAESNAASLRNPLATTMGAPGAHNANSVGVKGYPTDEIGLDATVRTLLNGHYSAILRALHRGTSAYALTQAVAMSPWGTGVNATRRLLSGG